MWDMEMSEGEERMGKILEELMTENLLTFSISLLRHSKTRDPANHKQKRTTLRHITVNALKAKDLRTSESSILKEGIVRVKIYSTYAVHMPHTLNLKIQIV